MKITQIREHTAGIDIGSESIFIGLDDDSVHQFGTFTCEFHVAIKLLTGHGVQSIAMESTGVYGVILHEMLQEAGFEVWLVNPAHLRYVPGRKSDVADCQWLQQLHSYGLLANSFLPDPAIKALRAYLRLRERYISESSKAVLHMQKALTLMNIRLHQVISQIHGASGMRVLRAILDGERDPHQLVALCDKRIQDNKYDQVVASLEGHYRQEYLYELADAIDCYEFFQGKLNECDRQIDGELSQLAGQQPIPNDYGKAKPIRHNKPAIDQLHQKVVRAAGGVNANELPGLTDYSALRLMGEVGVDLTPFPNEGHFTSWLKLAPGKKQSGKRIRTHKYKSAPRAAEIFKQAAQSLLESKNHALGAFGRRVRARRGPGIAIKAVARKLAILYYRAMTKGMDYVEQGVEAYEKQYQERRLHMLHKQASRLGYALIELNE
ncbi:MAG: IS110 family transposase [Balneolaceae bacterium]|nr:IS110 family transposase [Balneolaceae bacterium]